MNTAASAADTAATIVADVVGTVERVHIHNTQARIAASGSVRALNVSTAQGASVQVTVDEDQDLVVLGEVCNAVHPGVTFAGAGRPLRFNLDSNSPESGNSAAGTTLSGELDTAWGTAFCRFGTVSVAATLTPSTACGSVQRWSCAVPVDPDSSGTVVVTFSVDGSRWHEFHPRKQFRFIPTATCDVGTGVVAFPPGCSAAMLGNGVCDAACNTRSCASDNRDCAAPAVYMGPSGDDAAMIGSPTQPVATLQTATRLACTGFTTCLDIVVMPGLYDDCAATSLHLRSSALSIVGQGHTSPSLAHLPSPVFACSNASLAVQGNRRAHMEFNTSRITLTGVELSGVGVAAVTASTLSLIDVTLSKGATVEMVDSYLDLTRVHMRLLHSTVANLATASHTVAALPKAGGVAISYDEARLLAHTVPLTLAGWFCPACDRVGAVSPSTGELEALVNVASVTLHGAMPAGVGGAAAAAAVSLLEEGRVPVPSTSVETQVPFQVAGSSVATTQQYPRVLGLTIGGSSTASAGVTVGAGTLQLLQCTLREVTTVLLNGTTSQQTNSMTIHFVAAVTVRNAAGASRLNGVAQVAWDAIVPAAAALKPGIVVTASHVVVSALTVSTAGLGGVAPLVSAGSWLQTVESASAALGARVAWTFAGCYMFAGQRVVELTAHPTSELHLEGCIADTLTDTSGPVVSSATDVSVVVEVTGCTFVNCVATSGVGGTIAINGLASSLDIRSSSFVGNIAAGSGGGAVSLTETVANISDTTFFSNEGFGGGGALRVWGGSAQVAGCTFDGNSDNVAGAVFVFDATLTLEDSQLTNNGTTTTAST